MALESKLLTVHGYHQFICIIINSCLIPTAYFYYHLCYYYFFNNSIFLFAHQNIMVISFQSFLIVPSLLYLSDRNNEIWKPIPSYSCSYKIELENLPKTRGRLGRRLASPLLHDKQHLTFGSRLACWPRHHI